MSMRGSVFRHAAAPLQLSAEDSERPNSSPALCRFSHRSCITSSPAHHLGTRPSASSQPLVVATVVQIRTNTYSAHPLQSSISSSGPSTTHRDPRLSADYFLFQSDVVGPGLRASGPQVLPVVHTLALDCSRHRVCYSNDVSTSLRHHVRSYDVTTLMWHHVRSYDVTTLMWHHVRSSYDAPTSSRHHVCCYDVTTSIRHHIRDFMMLSQCCGIASVIPWYCDNIIVVPSEFTRHIHQGESHRLLPFLLHANLGAGSTNGPPPSVWAESFVTCITGSFTGSQLTLVAKTVLRAGKRFGLLPITLHSLCY